MPDSELRTMQEELEHYRSEREKIRTLVGQIGGVASRRKERIINITFIVLVAALFTHDALHYFKLINGLWPHTIAVEVAVLLVSVKIIWMMHQQSRVEHFQFWILNSIEFRLTDMGRRFQKMEKDLQEANANKDVSTPT